VDLTPAESDTLDLLDAYLTDLHAGRRPDRARLVAEFPHLAPHLDCLDQLDALAPDPNATLADPAGPAAAPAAEFVADGKYELLGELGRGGMGVVYKARQVGLERVVALKMILAGSMASEDQHRRFRAEAQVAARVQHPHVVQVFETGQINGLPYLVMQYVEGCSLAERLRAGPLPIEAAVRLAAAVARAVADLHTHGIVHRDLKPSNILLDAADRPFVTDFGLAKLIEGDSGATQSGTILGTVQYMAPEQAAGRGKEVSPAADVYALGSILYELLTGRPPFQAETPLDTLLAVLESEPEPPRRVNPKVPRVLEQVCLQCLDKVPGRRYPSADALATALEAYLKGEVVPTRRAGPIEVLRRWGRREPAFVSRLVALLLFCGVVQVFYPWLPDHPPAWQVQLLLVGWVGASWLCQQGLRWPGWGDRAAYAWGAVDVLFLTAVQALTAAYGGPIISPVIIGYPFLIAGAGLSAKQRIVWVTAACAMLGYAWLMAHDLSRPTPEHPLHRHLIFLICLAVLGFVMAYQVQRVRALSRYYEGPPRG
jgi:serine/threonine-protein kinase